ncbi:hypothetical protein [Brevundimonas sp.]|uniref:hypothetical protein n=1 Tax=Brevundimonas sp. TaxID=1871086 RepID=UPI0028A145D2|nr:hypothetical protein [Brevundimonas sp.]
MGESQHTPDHTGWLLGAPNKFRAAQWFIAETTYGDRLVLKSLPEEWSYDFTTADGTYLKAEVVERWMPFPDSQYTHPSPLIAAAPQMKEALEEVLRWDAYPNASCRNRIEAALAKANGTRPPLPPTARCE